MGPGAGSELGRRRRDSRKGREHTPMLIRGRPKSLGWYAAPLLLVVLAGCGGQPVDDSSTPPVDSGSGTTSSPSPTPSSVAAFEAGRVRLANGRSVHYRCTGTGSPPILLEAGSDVGGTEQYSDAMIDPLAAHTLVCTYDRPGTGQTAWLPNGWRPLDEVCRIENQVANGLHLKPPYLLFGHSGGAGMAIGCARRHPARIAALVLVEAGVDDPDELAKIPGFTDLSNSPEHLDYVDITREVNAIAGPIGDFPVLVFSSADEGGAKSQRRWLVLSPHSRQIVVAGGHNLQDDNPEALDRAILNLLSALQTG